MKVLEAETVIRCLERMKKYMPGEIEGRLIPPHKHIYMTCNGIDRIIQRLEEKSFEVDISGEENEGPNEVR